MDVVASVSPSEASCQRGLIAFRSSLQKVHEFQEYDKQRRAATVYVCFVSIASIFTRWSSSEASTHWAIVLQYPDGDWRVAEGACDDSGYLRAYYSKLPPDAWETCQKRSLGSVRISPFQFKEYVELNSLNNTLYYLIKNNCQHWATQLCERLGDEVPEQMEKLDTWQKCYPTLAYLFSAFSDVFGVVSSVSRIINPGGESATSSEASRLI